MFSAADFDSRQPQPTTRLLANLRCDQTPLKPLGFLFDVL